MRQTYAYLRRAPVSTEFFTSQPRCHRGSSPRNIHVAAAASPRPVCGIHARRKCAMDATKTTTSSSSEINDSPSADRALTTAAICGALRSAAPATIARLAALEMTSSAHGK